MTPSANRARPWPCSSGPSTCAGPTARTGRAWSIPRRRPSPAPSAARTRRPPSSWRLTPWPGRTPRPVCSGARRCPRSPPWPRTPSTTAAEHPTLPRFDAAVLTAMPMELAPLRRRMTNRRPIPELGPRAVAGRVAGVEIVAITVGVGTRAAVEATERLLRSVSVPHVLVVGIAGASAPHLRVGDVVVPETVIHGPSDARYTSTLVAGTDRMGTILTSDDLLVDAEAVATLHRRGITAMDMETGALPAVCERHGGPWTGFPVISGTADRPGDQDGVEVVNRHAP